MWFVLLVASAVSSANSISSLSDCSLAGWDTSRFASSNALQFGRYPDGTCSAWLTISPEENKINNGFRAELKDPLYAPIGATIEYSVDFLVTRASREATKSLVVMQWHDLADSSGNVRRPPLSLRLSGDTLRVVLFNEAIYRANPAGEGKVLWKGAFSWTRWNKLRVKAKWSGGNDGQIQMVLNGITIVNYKGPTGYPTDQYSPYLKMGPYTVHPLLKSAEALYRNYRRTVIAR